MKNIILLIITLTTSVRLVAQPEPQWSSSIASNFEWYIHDRPTLKFNGVGDIIVVGNVLSGPTGKDVLVVRYTGSGDIVWAESFHSTGDQDDEAIDFTIDPEDNILITGRTVIDSVNTDLVVLKVTGNGDLLWMHHFDGLASRADAGMAITVDTTGASYITGYTATDTLGHQKLLVYKVDALGDEVWEFQFGDDTTGVYHGEKISLLAGMLHVIGNFIGPMIVNEFHTLHVDLNGGSVFSGFSTINRPPRCYYQDQSGNSYVGFGGWDRFKISKFNSAGIHVWTDTIGTNLPSNVTADEVRAITVDDQHNVYVTGRHNGSDYGGPTYTNADIVTVKYAADGTRSWVRRYQHLGMNAADIGNAITLDEDLNVYVAGQSQRTAVATDYDYVIVKYDQNGDLIGTIRYDSGGEDAIWSVIVDENEAIYVTGLTFEGPASHTTTQKYDAISLGVEDRSMDPMLQCAPNPFNETTVITFERSENEPLHFSLLDPLGRIVHERTVTTDRIILDGAAINAGQYIGVLRGQRTHAVIRLIKME